MGMKETIKLTVNDEVTDNSLAFVEEKIVTFGEKVPPKIQNTFMIATDEMVSNVLNYSGATELELVLEFDGTAVSLTLIQNGDHFNPLEEKGNSEDASDILDKPIGGLGIHVVRKMMDDCQYQYQDQHNIFKMIKNV